MKQAENVVFGEALAAFEEVEFDCEGEAGDFSAELLDELYGGFHGAAGSEEIVYEDDALAGLDGVEMDFKGVGAVLKIVGNAGDGSGELAGLAYGNEAGVEAVSEGGAEDEAAGFDAEDEVDFAGNVVSRERINELRKSCFIFE